MFKYLSINIEKTNADIGIPAAIVSAAPDKEKYWIVWPYSGGLVPHHRFFHSGSGVNGCRKVRQSASAMAPYCPLATIYYPLPVALCPLPTSIVHCSLPNVYCCSLFSTYCPTAHCLLLTAHCLLPAVQCPLCAAHCLLRAGPASITHCPLSTVYCSLYCPCPLFIVNCQLPIFHWEWICRHIIKIYKLLRRQLLIKNQIALGGYRVRECSC
jgi:hypothetical protein